MYNPWLPVKNGLLQQNLAVTQTKFSTGMNGGILMRTVFVCFWKYLSPYFNISNIDMM